MSEYYCNWYTMPESMLLNENRRVWGVYRRINQHLSWKIAVCDTEKQAVRLRDALTESNAVVEVGG